MNSPETKSTPIHWRAVIQAIRAVGAEAARRGEMYPQFADEQREDKRAERRVVEMIEWYATKGGSVAMTLPDWPRHDVPADPPSEPVAWRVVDGGRSFYFDREPCQIGPALPVEPLFARPARSPAPVDESNTARTICTANSTPRR